MASLNERLKKANTALPAKKPAKNKLSVPGSGAAKQVENAIRARQKAIDDLMAEMD
jgi:hypothetical protein